MDKSLIILLLCLSSVYSDTEMKEEVPKDEVLEKVDDTSASVKSKRYSVWPDRPTPCPPHWPHYNQGWNMPAPQKVKFVQPHYVPKPAVTVVKVNSGWNPWQQNQGWSKPTYDFPMSGWNNGWQSPSVQPVWKPPVIQTPYKPAYSYAPSYHHKPAYQVPIYNDWVKPQLPECPPEHGHAHTGIVYAPQHQYHHQPQIVKVAKPVYQHPQYQYPQQPQIFKPHYQYHQQPQIVKVAKPVFHLPQPVYHHTPSFHHPVHHLPQHEPCD